MFIILHDPCWMSVLLYGLYMCISCKVDVNIIEYNYYLYYAISYLMYLFCLEDE